MDHFGITTIVLFAIAFILIIFEHQLFHRTLSVSIIASILVLTGILSVNEAWDSIDFNTIFLLVGMMNLVNLTGKSGIFTTLANGLVKVTGNSPIRLMIGLSLATAFVSTILDNVTTILFLAPIAIEMVLVLKLNPVPFIISMAIASNIGGAATLIGDPPNIIIGSLGNKTFNDFIVNVAPFVLAGLIVNIFLSTAMLRYSIHHPAKAKTKYHDDDGHEEHHEGTMTLNKNLAVKSLIVLSITLVLFIFGKDIAAALNHQYSGLNLELEPGIVAIFMSFVLTIISRASPEWLFKKVEWTTLFFFIGLFVIMGAMEKHGVFKAISEGLVAVVDSNLNLGMIVTGSASVLISGLVDNIPFTMATAKVLKVLIVHSPNLDPLWWVLSIGSCLGGNLTLIGASANIVSSDISARYGFPISFLTFLKYGLPAALVSSIVALGSFILFRNI